MIVIESLEIQEGPDNKALECLVEKDGIYPSIAEELLGNFELNMTFDMMTELPGQHRLQGKDTREQVQRS